jgi:hypothetical protein
MQVKSSTLVEDMDTSFRIEETGLCPGCCVTEPTYPMLKCVLLPAKYTPAPDATAAEHRRYEQEESAINTKWDGQLRFTFPMWPVFVPKDNNSKFLVSYNQKRRAEELATCSSKHLARMYNIRECSK